MENVLFTLTFLACPLGMGLMMWFMAKATRKDVALDSQAVPRDVSVEQLREEHRRLGDELERLDRRSASPSPEVQRERQRALATKLNRRARLDAPASPELEVRL